MEIGRARTPRRIPSNASQITPPGNKSMKRCAKWHYDWPAHRMHEVTRLDLDLYTARRPSNIQSLSQFVDRASQVPTISKGAKERTDGNIRFVVFDTDENTRMQQDKGCVRNRKSEQEKKGCWRQKIKYNMTRERVC